ncbi:hypothetical protein Esti_003980 [Eimeria stiedai]
MEQPQQQEHQQQQQKQKQQQRWLPLEANPDVLGPYLEALGGPREGPPSSAAGGPPLLRFEDVVCLEPWAFDMLECSDTVALLLLFPLLKGTDEEELRLLPLPELQQQHDAELQQELWAKEETLALDGARRGAALEASPWLEALHATHQERGQTAAAAAADTDAHFTCFIPWKGFVVELDGRKHKPLIRARIADAQTFAQAAAEVIQQQFVQPRGVDMHFAVLAVGDARSARS